MATIAGADDPDPNGASVPRPAPDSALDNQLAYFTGEIVCDDAGRPQDVRVLTASDHLSGAGAVELAGRTLLEVNPGLDQAWLENYWYVVRERRPLRFELGSQAQGRWFEVFATPLPTPGQFTAVLKDRTVDKLASLATASGRTHLPALSDQLPFAVWMLGPRAELQYVNEALCAFFGVPRERMNAWGGWRRVVHPEDAARVTDALVRACGERTPFTGEVRVRRADGMWRWMQSWSTPNYDADGTYLGLLGASIDVTDRFRSEKVLRARAHRDGYRAKLSERLARAQDPRRVQEEACRTLGEHLGAGAAFAEVDPSGPYVTVVTGRRGGRCLPPGRYRIDDGAPELVSAFRGGQQVVVEDVRADRRLSDAARQSALALGVGAFVATPLTRDGHVLASILAHSEQARPWTSNDLAVIDETVRGTRTALEAARVQQARVLRQQRAELSAELLDALGRPPTLQAQLQCLTDVLVPAFADAASVRLDGHGATLTARSGPEPAAQSTPGPAPAQDDPAAPTRLSVPFDVGHLLRGRLDVRLLPGRRPYDEDAATFLQLTAARAGAALAAAQLRREEHDISVQLQRALLPDSLVWDPSVVVSARYAAASDVMEVGGDWYDSFGWRDGRIGLIVGDVVGHSLQSVAAMGRLRSATAALATHLPPEPAALLDTLEEFASGPGGTDFATACCVIVDPATGLLTYSSAGHPPGLVVDPDGKVAWLDGVQGPPVCGLSAGTREQATTALAPGSLVLLYSDGLVERRGESIDAGLARLAAVAAELAGADVDAVPGAVIDRLTGPAAGQDVGREVDDDVVVACLRYSPSRGAFERTIPADAAQVRALRADLRAWLEGHGLDPGCAFDVLLCVGEAVSNSVEHAYPDRGGLYPAVQVRVSHHGGYLAVQVGDRGRWRPVDPVDLERGRGTTLMNGVAYRFSRRIGPDGTRVGALISTEPAASTSSPGTSRRAGQAPAAATGLPQPRRRGGADTRSEAAPRTPAGTVTSRTDGEVVTIAVTGDLDLGSAAEMQRHIDVMPAGGLIRLDLSAVSYLDSFGLRLLEHLTLRHRDGQLRVSITAPAGSPVGRLMQLTGVGADLRQDSPD